MTAITASRGLPTPRPCPSYPTSTTGCQTRRTTRPADPLSERATAQLIRRNLIPQSTHILPEKLTAAAIEEKLPRITGNMEVDFQSYAIVAIMVRDFVKSWYGRITGDEEFVERVVEVVVGVLGGLTERVNGVDLESLVLDEVMDLMERHVIAFRAAKSPGVRGPVEADARVIYHAMFPLPALSPVPDSHVTHSISRQKKNETRYRQLLVQGMLAVLLKTEDLQNPVLTSLLTEILAETIIGNVVGNKLSQPWMIWEVLNIVVRMVKGDKNKEAGRKKSLRGSKAAAESIQSEVQGKKSKISTWKRMSFQGLIIMLVQWGITVYSFIRGIVNIYHQAKALPSRHGRGLYITSSQLNPVDKVPIVTFKMFSFAGTLIELEDRMPWLSGNLAMIQWGLLKGPWHIGALDCILDRFLSHTINTKIFDPSRVPLLIKSIRGALYPNNMPGKPTLVPPANATEEQTLRKRTAAALASLAPNRMLQTYYCGGAWRPALDLQISGGNLEVNQDIEQRIVAAIDESIVDVFSDEYCNRHLMYGILEVVIARLMPELAEKGVEELLSDRLGV